MGNPSHRPCLYLVTRVMRTLCRHYARGYEYDTVVVQALCRVYECYAMSAQKAGGPESVKPGCWFVCVNIGRVWGVVEKVGQGAQTA